MKQCNKKNGFTLIELLVAIAILGIIIVIALPQVNKLQDTNRKTEYKKYAESMLTSGKLYVNAYAEDLFGNNTSGCVDISYDEMRNKNLLKALEIDGVDCRGVEIVGGIETKKTFVRVNKISNDSYTYKYSIYCKDKNNNEVYKELLAGDCAMNPDGDAPIISFNKNKISWTNNENQTIKVKISDPNGMLENTEIKYIWERNGVEIGEYKVYEFKNIRNANPLETEDILVPYSVGGDGEYRLKVLPIKVVDSVGNSQTGDSISEPIQIDKTKPTCTNSGGSTSWTTSNVTITGTCSDIGGSGCVDSTVTKQYTSDTNLTSISPGTVKDKAGNSTTCPYDRTVKIDRTKPNCFIAKTDWGSEGVDISVTCSADAKNCPLDQTIYGDKTFYIQDSAGNSNTCSVDVLVERKDADSCEICNDWDCPYGGDLDGDMCVADRSLGEDFGVIGTCSCTDDRPGKCYTNLYCDGEDGYYRKYSEDNYSGYNSQDDYCKNEGWDGAGHFEFDVYGTCYWDGDYDAICDDWNTVTSSDKCGWKSWYVVNSCSPIDDKIKCWYS